MRKNIPDGPAELDCPLHRASMSTVCKKCPWWTQIRGVNPNTGADVDEWSCAVGLLPMLLLNTAQETRQGAAATESFRNEFVKLSMAQLMKTAGAPELTPPKPAHFLPSPS
jgi:hypothetical protein